MKRFILLLLVILSSILLFSCAVQLQTNESFAMDTVIRQTVYASDADVIIQNNDILREIENEMSKTINTSDVSRLNAANGASVDISAATAQVLETSLAEAEKTDGAFSPALGGVIDAWGFGTENARIPDAEELSDLLSNADYKKVTVDPEGGTASANDMQIDLGGAVKGYALDRIAENLQQNNIESAVISLGGSIYAKGTKPDGSSYKIGIRDPYSGENDYMGTILLEGKFVSTSGIYERGFEKDGVWYHHIIDPKTGYPADNGIESVTVVADSGILSDIYSTALFVMGVETGIEFAQQNGLDVLYLTKNKEIVTTDGFREKYDFKVKNTNYREQAA
ncbi:FAD:protein FMN transferase [Christensenella hongkongensis]|uniref:FAD:protein FMN transferase n=1 Tax=Christensenella hongkongensis TaxID=270498 RepID=UPI0026737483|nr:FAD:protein FMN transferase [Christensenella hongkongensis]